MRLRKQSMRQLKDAAIVERLMPEALSQAARTIQDSINEPLRRPVPQSREKPIYVRGALVKSSKRD